MTQKQRSIKYIASVKKLKRDLLLLDNVEYTIYMSKSMKEAWNEVINKKSKLYFICAKWTKEKVYTE